MMHLHHLGLFENWILPNLMVYHGLSSYSPSNDNLRASQKSQTNPNIRLLVYIFPCYPIIIPMKFLDGCTVCRNPNLKDLKLCITKNPVWQLWRWTWQRTEVADEKNQMGFPIHGGTPSSLDGWFHGKSHQKMDDLGVPNFRKSPDVSRCSAHIVASVFFDWNKHFINFIDVSSTATYHDNTCCGRLWMEKIIRGVPCLEDPEKTETFEAVSTSTEVSETRLAEDAETMSGMPEMPKTRSESWKTSEKHPGSRFHFQNLLDSKLETQEASGFHWISLSQNHVLVGTESWVLLDFFRVSKTARSRCLQPRRRFRCENSIKGGFFQKTLRFHGFYHLVNVQKTMENHHF